MQPIVLPELGRLPITVSHWYVGVGDEVREGERVVEVVTGHATFAVSSPTTGRLLERRAVVGEVVRPGDSLGVVGE